MYAGERMKIHHIGIAVLSIAEDGAAYCRALNLPPIGPIVADETQKVRVAFARVDGDVHVEFIEPLGPDSPIHGVLRQGGGVYHICYSVPDIAATIEQIKAGGGVMVSGPVAAPAFEGRRIAFCYVGHSLLELVETPE
jgi:catechol 2,3-dioxygenase-like lactoylglutathione lyase family enzyme